MAIAAALSARECILDGRDSRYSAAQIWNCAGSGIASCDTGTFLNLMLRGMAMGPHASSVLLAETCTQQPIAIAADPNVTACLAASAACVPSASSSGAFFENNAQMQAIVGMDVSVFLTSPGLLGVAENNARAWAGSMHALMREIFERGPAVSVLTLVGADIPLFVGWQARDDVFVPRGAASNATVAQQASRYHCISVVGWGVAPPAAAGGGNTTTTAAGGIPFWWVQNSYSARWGRLGMGKIVRGQNVLEARWRGLSTLARPCFGPGQPDPQGILDEPCLPVNNNSSMTTGDGQFYGRYDLFGKGLLAPPASTTPPPINYYDEYLPPTTVLSPPAGEQLWMINGWAVLGVACLCVAFVTGLGIILLPAAAIPQTRQPTNTEYRKRPA